MLCLSRTDFPLFSVLPQVLHPVNAWFTYLVLNFLSKITKHIFALHQPRNTIQHPESVQNWIMGGRVMFQSIFKCFPVERDHVQPYWSWAMLTLASRLQLFPFAFRFPLTISTSWASNCVWIVAHGHCMCVCYCRYMTPSQLLLEDARVFPFGWTEKKKSPCSQKLDYWYKKKSFITNRTPQISPT